METIEQGFRRYLAAFNDRRYDEMLSFYTPDVELVLPANTCRGPAEIERHYLHLHRHVRELLDVTYLVADEHRLATELYTEFHCAVDLPTFSLKPLRAGEVLRCTNFVHYDVVEGRFSNIRVARYLVHD